jgi:hypothetical protein
MTGREPASKPRVESRPALQKEHPMKATRPALLAAAIVLLTIVVSGAEPAELSEAEKACLLATTPGAQHELLASLAGTWNYTGRFWTDPSGDPTEASGVSTQEMILEGRYLVDRTSSEFMGGEFEGIGLTGHDNTTGEFLRTWIDNMSTTVAFARGHLDESGRVLTFRGQFVDPATGQKGESRSVTRFDGENRHRLEYWIKLGGSPEVKVMDLEYVRQAGA